MPQYLWLGNTSGKQTSTMSMESRGVKIIFELEVNGAPSAFHDEIKGPPPFWMIPP